MVVEKRIRMEKAILVREDELKKIISEHNLDVDLDKIYQDYGLGSFEQYTDEDGDIVYIYTGYAGKMSNQEEDQAEYAYVVDNLVKEINDILFTMDLEKKGEI
jgi:hypothetical protein